MPALRQPLSDRQLRLGECHAEARRSAHHLAGRLHLGSENRVDAGETDEREHRALDEDARDLEILGQAELRERAASHHPGGDLRQRHAGRLGEVRHRSRRARIHFEHVDHVVLGGELDVHQPDDVERARDAPRVVANRRQVALGADERRHHARTVARVNARLLDVLHDAADDDGAGRIGDGIDVELEGILEEPVDEHRMLGRGVDGARHVAIERAHVVDDGHAAAAEHVRRPHDDRESDRVGDGARLFARWWRFRSPAA